MSNDVPKNPRSSDKDHDEPRARAKAQAASGADRLSPGARDRALPTEGGEDEPKETQPGGKDAPPDA